MSVSWPGSTAGKNLVNALPSAVLKAFPGTKRIATERKRHHRVIPPPNSAASLPHSSLLRSWHTDFHPQAIAHTGRTQGGAAARRQRRAQPRARAVHAGPRTGPVPDQSGSHGTQTACYARPSSSLPLSSSRSCRSGAPASRCDRLRDHCPRTTPAIMTAEPLKPRRHLGVIQVGIIAAVGTDELIYAVVSAVDAAVHDADRLVPRERRAAVAGSPASGIALAAPDPVHSRESRRSWGRGAETAAGRAASPVLAAVPELPGLLHLIHRRGQ